MNRLTSYMIVFFWSSEDKFLRSILSEIKHVSFFFHRLVFILTRTDVKWKTYTCILGWPVMGVWDPYTDGTDINAVDVCQTHPLVVTGT